MTTHAKFIVLVGCLFLLLSGCEEEDPLADCSVALPKNFSFSIDGKKHCGEPSIKYRKIAEGVTSNWTNDLTILIGNNTGTTISLQANIPITSDVYEDTQEYSNDEFTIATLYSQGSVGAESMKITITKFDEDAKKISGSFDGTLYFYDVEKAVNVTSNIKGKFENFDFTTEIIN